MLDPRTFPRPPALQQISKQILIKFPGPEGQTIASTSRAYWVLETWHPPTYYIPPEAISIKLTPTSRRSYCEWKGPASYFSFDDPHGQRIDGRAWTYKDPTPTFAAIKDYVSFYAGDAYDCYVDGEKVEPQVCIPVSWNDNAHAYQSQPGDFYGGWMTSDILRKNVKGAPGTRGW